LDRPPLLRGWVIGRTGGLTNPEPELATEGQERGHRHKDKHSNSKKGGSSPVALDGATKKTSAGQGKPREGKPPNLGQRQETTENEQEKTESTRFSGGTQQKKRKGEAKKRANRRDSVAHKKTKTMVNYEETKREQVKHLLLWVKGTQKKKERGKKRATGSRLPAHDKEIKNIHKTKGLRHAFVEKAHEQKETRGKNSAKRPTREQEKKKKRQKEKKTQTTEYL